MDILGIDIGGSGIKGAVVDAETGELLTKRRRIGTPDPSTPQAVAEVVLEIVRHFGWVGPMGCTFPAVIRNGIVCTAANVDSSWIGTDAPALFERVTDCPASIVNDADAAGIAEMVFGAGRDQPGVVVLLTLGTGIGSALFVDGHLAPNTEFGHLEIDGHNAESRAASSARKREKLSWEKWGKRLNRYFQTVEFLLSPDLFIIGGGVSKRSQKYVKYIDVRAPIVAAQMRNHAGLIGGAMAAHALIQGGGDAELDPAILYEPEYD